MKLPDAQAESENPFGEVRGLGYTRKGKLISISENGALCFEDKAICYDAMPSPTGVIPDGRIASFGVAGDRAVFAWRASKLIVLRPGTTPIALGRSSSYPTIARKRLLRRRTVGSRSRTCSTRSICSSRARS